VTDPLLENPSFLGSSLDKREDGRDSAAVLREKSRISRLHIKKKPSPA
jgi:hypothetical protein